MQKTATKERPICLQHWEVKAILEGRKTQLRRPMRDQPVEVIGKGPAHLVGEADQWLRCDLASEALGRAPFWTTFKPEYGLPGDRLWVREAWNCKDLREYDPSGVFSMSTGEVGVAYRAGGGSCACPDGTWKSAADMPRWASRLMLLITAVRIERTKGICAADAAACGIAWGEGPPRSIYTNHVIASHSWWDADYGKKHPWNSNPWVWVIDFTKVEP